jgi:hypothetical protein
MKTKNNKQKIVVNTNLAELKSARKIAVLKSLGMFMADVQKRAM